MRPRSALALSLLSLAASVLLAQTSSHERNPTIVFPAPGNYDVTLTVCNDQGACSTKTRTITVLDPAPHITSAVAQPTPVPIGHLVTLSAKATGKPTIAFDWTVTAPTGAVTLFSGNPATWRTTGLVPGSYSIDLRADSSSGTATAHAGTVILVPELPASFWTFPKPCRVVDTRSTTPLLSTDPPRVFSASTAACPVPATAVALAANLTVVNPTGPGFLTVFAGNDYPPQTSDVTTDPRHPARASFAILPLSTDGRTTLAARFGSDRAASVHLIVDVSGYFAPTRAAPPVALAFNSPLCPVFCIFPGGAPLALHYQVAGAPTTYRYDWTGSGSFTQTSATPLASHLFPSSGYYAPRLQVVATGAPASTISFAPPILVTDPVPAAAPRAPTGVRASFLGVLPADPLDPTQTAPEPAFAISVVSPAGNTLLGWNVYFSLDNAPWTVVTALPPDLPASAPLRLAPWDPSRHSARIALAAVNWAAQGPLSAAISLTVPRSALEEAERNFIHDRLDGELSH